MRTLLRVMFASGVAVVSFAASPASAQSYYPLVGTDELGYPTTGRTCGGYGCQGAYPSLFTPVYVPKTDFSPIQTTCIDRNFGSTCYTSP